MDVTQNTKDIVYKVVRTDNYRVRHQKDDESVGVDNSVDDSVSMSIPIGTRVHIENMYVNEYHPDMVEVYVPSMKLFIQAISFIELKKIPNLPLPPRPSVPKDCGHYYNCGCYKSLCGNCMENRYYRCPNLDCQDRSCSTYYKGKTKDAYCLCDKPMCDYCY